MFSSARGRVRPPRRQRLEERHRCQHESSASTSRRGFIAAARAGDEGVTRQAVVSAAWHTASISAQDGGSRMALVLQLAQQPEPGQPPVPLHGIGGHRETDGDLVDRQPTEEAPLDNGRLTCVHNRQQF